VGLITGLREDRSAYQQTVTTACHHCADPGCLNGCPVLAYEKDSDTGIVRHLDDQCIGCQYCILKCPYDVPKYNDRLGIVRKCDMCHQRLAAGEAPACVQACPTHAIRIVNVAVDASARTTDTSRFLPSAPDPAVTQPTTRYLSSREMPVSVTAADTGVARVQPSHAPLAILLTLSQFALGLQVAACFATVRGSTSPSGMPGGLVPGEMAALGLLGLALVASVAHLGQPLRAWRVFLGLQRSWLSREAVVFGLWFALLGTSVFGQARAIGLAALVAGAAGVFCSAMIYIDTGRRGWSAPQVFAKFAGTIAIGVALTLAPLAAFAAVSVKLALEWIALLHGPWQTRALADGKLKFAFRMRRLLGATGAFLLAVAAAGETGAWPVAVLFVVAGEIAERLLFFRAVDGSKMPGTGVT